jgi:hypothetical protein
MLSAAFAGNLVFPVEVTGQCSFTPKELITKLTPWFPKRQAVSVVDSVVEVTVIAPKPTFYLFAVQQVLRNPACCRSAIA